MLAPYTDWRNARLVVMCVATNGIEMKKTTTRDGEAKAMQSRNPREGVKRGGGAQKS